MYKILKKRYLAENVVEFVIEAKLVAKNCKSGQFIILRVDEDGERVPFTICDYDRISGAVTILVQTIGYTTLKLAKKNEGEYISDFAGPLGKPTDLSEFKNIILVGGGIGSAVVYPQTKQLFAEGKPSTVIIGARNKSLLVYEDEFRKYAKKLIIMTDDGSYGKQGFVTNALQELLDGGVGRDGLGAPLDGVFDCVFAVGPLPMMKAVCNLTRNYNIHTVVSMNSVMVDGTGMCGCCRLTVGGETKYACVHGPEFDGHKIDFDEAINRSKNYLEAEQAHKCRLNN